MWAFFGLKKDDNESVICRLCRAIILVRKGNTTNLFTHLKVHHAKEYASIEKSKKKNKSAEDSGSLGGSGQQITLGQAIERSKAYTRGSQRWKEITESVTHFMAKEMIPFNTVKKPGMMRKLDPRYEVPSRKYFSKTALPSLQRVLKELQEAEYYSVTTDLWSSTGKLEPYLAVTLHYINQEWGLKSCCLSTLFCHRTILQ